MVIKKANKPPIKKKYIESPQKMWELFEQYAIWAKKNPYKVKDWVGGMGKAVTRHKERPLSFVGFEAWLFKNGVISDLGHYERNTDGSYESYLPIITHIKKIIEADQFDGASAGIYQQNIIARKLGLTEKSTVELKSEQPLFPDTK